MAGECMTEKGVEVFGGSGLGLEVWGLEFGVWDLGVGVRVCGSGFLGLR